MHYFDTSALVKLVIEEAESPAFTVFLATVQRPVTSELSRIELSRVALRLYPDGLKAVSEMFRKINVMPISRDVVSAASLLQPATLRTLDAIHLASALELRDGLQGFVAYDERLLTAATEHGLQVITPR